MFRKSIAVLLVITFISVGCATTSTDPTNNNQNRAKKGAKFGAIFGALAGAALGVATGQDTEGIIRRATVGAAAGAAIGYGVGKAKDKKLASRDEAAQRYAYHSSQGDFLKMDSVRVSPARVAPGSEVAVTITYTVLVPKVSTDVAVVYQNALFYGSDQVLDFGSDKKVVTDGGGTVEVTYPVTIPKKASAGTYAFRSSVGISGTQTKDAGSTNLYVTAS